MDIPTELNASNIDDAIAKYKGLLNEIPLSITATSVIDLARLLKRSEVNQGPYPRVSLFETLNRVMTDLIILFGVKKLLNDKCIGSVSLPYTSYSVQYGSANDAGYDVYSKSGNSVLIGEAFNVSKAFFQAKKTKMLKKLRDSKESYSHLLIMCNDDAFEEGYSSQMITSNEFFFPVAVSL